MDPPLYLFSRGNIGFIDPLGRLNLDFPNNNYEENKAAILSQYDISNKSYERTIANITRSYSVTLGINYTNNKIRDSPINILQ